MNMIVQSYYHNYAIEIARFRVESENENDVLVHGGVCVLETGIDTPNGDRNHVEGVGDTVPFDEGNMPTLPRPLDCEWRIVWLGRPQVRLVARSTTVVSQQVFQQPHPLEERMKLVIHHEQAISNDGLWTDRWYGIPVECLYGVPVGCFQRACAISTCRWE